MNFIAIIVCSVNCKITRIYFHICPLQSDVDVALNYWVIMSVCIFCFLCSLVMPETLGLPLPQTLSEANTLGDNRPLHKWVHHWNLHEFEINKDAGSPKPSKRRSNLPELVADTPEARTMMQ